MDLGGSERFGAAFGFGGADRYDNRGSSKGGGKSKGGRGGKGDRGEMDELLEEALADGDGPIRVDASWNSMLPGDICLRVFKLDPSSLRTKIIADYAAEFSRNGCWDELEAEFSTICAWCG
ncbi:unnamed protein product [Polarella glacialis]|uniref:Uncharacterized protein n=1 Tax=Polarella glacialis TaxID=89957 RepID=A0A813FE92_POLGL|nr:unnamed protein product [Polarella glacialis]